MEDNTQQLLLLALVYLDRTLDDDCDFIERIELNAEIAKLLYFMRPADAAYYQAIHDVLNFVNH